MSESTENDATPGHWYPQAGLWARPEIVEKAKQAAARRGAPEIVHDHPHGEPCERGECQTFLPPAPSVLTL